MKTVINNSEYIIIFEENTIDNLTYLHNKLKKIPKSTKIIVLDLINVEYINSIFIDYLMKYNELLKEKKLKLKIINCSENIYSLINKSYKNHSLEIKIKDI